MTPHTPYDQPGSRLDLPSGASQVMPLRPGATLICTEGSIRVEESANGLEATGGLHCVVRVRLNAGEVHGVSYGGAVRITALAGAQVICLESVRPVPPILRRVAAFFRRILSKNGNIRVGALHKISK